MKRFLTGSRQIDDSIGSSVTDEQRYQHGDRNRDAELEEVAADDAAHERDRHEHGDDRERRRGHGEADLVGAVECGAHVRLAHVQVPHDVLAHDDGVVDQQADAETERHQRQEIQREAEDVQRNESRDDRDRQGQAGDDRRAPGMQEQEDDQHRQKAALENRFLDPLQRVLDEFRVGFDDLDLDIVRQSALQLLDRLLHAIADLHDVRVLHLED